jgi:hypothetical protein
MRIVGTKRSRPPLSASVAPNASNSVEEEFCELLGMNFWD